jgi:AcrR family transcriptional regulator
MSAVEQELPKGGDHRREQVLRAALEVIAERGFGDTRIADVAGRAEVSPALVVYYFKTRDRLLTEAIRLGEESWYAAVDERLRSRTLASEQLAEIVAMTCFADETPGVDEPWSLWLDLWAQSAHNESVGAVRREFDARWRSTLRALVIAGQQQGEFRAVDSDDFAVAFSALLDGFAVQFALSDVDVEPDRAFRLAMTFASEHLGFAWKPTSKSRQKVGRR